MRPFFSFFLKKTRLRDIKTAPCNACDGKHLLDMQHTHICQNTIGHVKITYAYVSATLRTYGPHSAWAHALFGGTPAPDIETIATLCTHTHTHTHTHREIVFRDIDVQMKTFFLWPVTKV